MAMVADDSSDALKLMSHSGQAALSKLGKSKQPDQLLKDWNKTIQELGKYPHHLGNFFALNRSWLLSFGCFVCILIHSTCFKNRTVVNAQLSYHSVF